MKLGIEITAPDGPARAGVVRTARGEFRTPVFMPVGTRGTIRALTSNDLAQVVAGDGTAPEIMLANTYHLMMRPGAETVAPSVVQAAGQIFVSGRQAPGEG